MMSSCWTLRLKRRRAFSNDSPSCSRTSANLITLVVIIVIVFAVALVFLFVVFVWLLSKEDTLSLHQKA